MSLHNIPTAAYLEGLCMSASVAPEPIDIDRILVKRDELEPRCWDGVVVRVVGQVERLSPRGARRVLVRIELHGRVRLVGNGRARLHPWAVCIQIGVSKIMVSEHSQERHPVQCGGWVGYAVHIAPLAAPHVARLARPVEVVAHHGDKQQCLSGCLLLLDERVHLVRHLALALPRSTGFAPVPQDQKVVIRTHRIGHDAKRIVAVIVVDIFCRWCGWRACKARDVLGVETRVGAVCLNPAVLIDVRVPCPSGAARCALARAAAVGSSACNAHVLDIISITLAAADGSA
mmetsp:Transcript_61328/g.136589  ORF Transcript_61328/g.136589 Transcript_61328/m.136589 type:complete len:288 (+) Transcript_61328:228-1091(+)